MLGVFLNLTHLNQGCVNIKVMVVGHSFCPSLDTFVIQY